MFRSKCTRSLGWRQTKEKIKIPGFNKINKRSTKDTLPEAFKEMRCGRRQFLPPFCLLLNGSACVGGYQFKGSYCSLGVEYWGVEYWGVELCFVSWTIKGRLLSADLPCKTGRACPLVG